MRATVDLWKWYYDYGAYARARHDSERIRLFNFFDSGVQYRYRDPAQALSTFEAGAELARQLNEPCWEVFYEHWCCEIYVFSLRDLEKGLEHSIRTFTLAHKSGYLHCPILARVYRILIDVYYIIDVEGNLEKIHQMLDYMTRNVPLDQDTYLLTERRRAGLHYSFDEWDDAEREALKYLNLARGDYYRESDAYHFLCNIAMRQKQPERAYEYALELERIASNKPRVVLQLAHALLAQAVYKQSIEEIEEAERLYERGTAIFHEHKAKLGLDYYDLVCIYHERMGDADTALKLRDRQLQELVESSSPSFELYCRLQRCRLLGRLGRPVAQELADAYEATKKLLKADYHTKKLKQVENGDYADD